MDFFLPCEGCYVACVCHDPNGLLLRCNNINIIKPWNKSLAGVKQLLSKISAKELQMLFKSKALVVAFLTVVVSSQAFSATASPAAPSDTLSPTSGSSLLDIANSSSVAGVGKLYGTSTGSLTDGAMLDAGDSKGLPVFKDVQAFVEFRNGEIVISDATVPEPESYAMFLAGLGIIAAMVRRRSRSV